MVEAETRDGGGGGAAERLAGELALVDVTSLSFTYLLGRNIRYRKAATMTTATTVKKLKPTSPVMRPPSWYTTRAEQ